jgi:hypothetical protein
LVQKRPVDLLDVDPAVLYWLERVGGSTNLRAATSGSAKGRGATNFIPTLLVSRNPLMQIKPCHGLPIRQFAGIQDQCLRTLPSAPAALMT